MEMLLHEMAFLRIAGKFPITPLTCTHHRLSMMNYS